MNVAVATKLPVDEIAVALAIHCRLHDHNPREAASQLDVTPRAHFDEACVWAKSNAKVVQLIADDPTAIAAGSYSLSPARGLLSRLFGKKRTDVPLVDEELDQVMRDMQGRERAVDEKRQQRLEALRALVDESFDAP